MAGKTPERFINDMREGCPVRIAYMGGSVTVGAGATDQEQTSWRGLVCQYLRERHPKTEFDFVSAGIGGTDSTYGVFRFDAHVWKRGSVDLLFLEFAVNDAGDRGLSIRAMEGIIRKARRRNPAIRIIMLYFAVEDHSAIREQGEIPANIVHHDEVARHYDIPTIDLSAEVTDSVRRGAVRFQDMFNDIVHPNDTGHRFYADHIIRFLEDRNDWLTRDPGVATPLPDPIHEGNHEHGELVPVEDVWVEAKGFAWHRDFYPDRVINVTAPCDVLEGTSPGSFLRIRAEGRAFGMALMVGDDCGEVSCFVDGEWVEVEELWDQWCSMGHRPKIAMFATDLPWGEHEINMIISEKRNSGSRGHAIRILHFLMDTGGDLS